MTQELKSQNSNVSYSNQENPYKKLANVKGVWQTPFATQLTVRNFTFYSDQPLDVGGKDKSPTPIELIAGAVNGCVTIVLEVVAKELDITLYDIKTESYAHIDTRGFLGIADVPTHYSDYRLDIEITTDANEEKLEKLKRVSAKRCPAVNLLRDAKVDLDIHWIINTQEKPI